MRKYALTLIPLLFLISNKDCDKLCKVVDCPTGYHCVKGECIKDEVIPPPVECLPEIPQCPADRPCSDTTGQCKVDCQIAPNCPVIPPPPLNCSNIDCLPGYTCTETPEGPKCIQNPEPGPTPYPGDFIVTNKDYGRGKDSTPTAIRSCDYCASIGYGTIGGQPRCSCPFLPDGDPNRLKMELVTLGGCPTWQWSINEGGPWYPCIDKPDEMSCDHFQFDDPQTPEYEGNIPECASQKDVFGHFKAGFWTEVHGDGWVKACDANGEHCGNPTRVQH